MVPLIFLPLMLSLLPAPTTPQAASSLPLPSLINEIQPSLAIYSSAGEPPCFNIPFAYVPPKDLARIIGEYGGWEVPRVVFITHSFRESLNTPWLHVLKNAILQVQPEATVVLLGWEGGANLPNLPAREAYKKATGNIKGVGPWLGDLAREVRRIRPRMYIHGIGHSLGAHLMGIAGRSAPGTFDRITGLDPAGPYFEGGNIASEGWRMRLQRGDAKLVDIIHADGCTQASTTAAVESCWVSANNHYGLLSPVGTIDFYPNYGELNPVTHVPVDIDKSHTRGVDLFIISVLHPSLFRTNETLEGTPGPFGITKTRNRVRQGALTAEMGYWLEAGYVPSHIDTVTNFYLPPETLVVAEKMGTMEVASTSVNRRKRRSVVEETDCAAVPAKAGPAVGVAPRAFVFSIIVAISYDFNYWI